MTSTIYDLGYQRYSGVRFGRMHAVRTLFIFSARTAFGLGRGERSRLIPLLVLVLVFLPAVVQIGVASAAGMVNIISYANYLEFTAGLLALFVAAQAPELLVTDKSNGTLALYLSRPIRASDYAWAKLGALAAALLLLTLGPQLMLFGGRVLIQAEPWTAFKAEWTKLFPILAGTLLVSTYFASIALAISSFAKKRAFASAGVIAFFLLTPAVSAMVRVIATGDLRRYAALLNPVHLVTGFSKWLFDVEAARRSTVARVDLPGETYLFVVLATCVIGALVLLARYRKNEV